MNISTGNGLKLKIVAFDFTNKSLHLPAPDEIHGALEQGEYIWIDLEYRDHEAARAFISKLGKLDERTIEYIFDTEEGTHLTRFPDYLHLQLAVCDMHHDGALKFTRIDNVFTPHLMITIHKRPHFVIDTVRDEYESDFMAFAQTPSFLVYELWDAVIEHFAEIQKQLELKVERMQHELVQTIDDRIFLRVSEIDEDLLHFRSVLMPARTSLIELASRRTHLISEATQAALGNMAGALERILQDVLVDREILTQSLSLHMSMVSHRTNQAVSKLTVVSFIFLPLTFLCGIYGMNFVIFPELRWHYGYLFFWGLCATIVTILLVILRRIRLL
jgi:magnesium transporter